MVQMHITDRINRISRGYKTDEDKTAPMGWNSLDCYGAAVTEDIVRRNAEFMAEHLKEYGWEYVVVDIQWYEPYAATNYLRCIIQI